MSARRVGCYALAVEGRVLRLDTTGPWNEVIARSFHDDVSSVVERELTGSPWGLLALVRGEPVHVPESEQLVIEGIKLRRQQGMCAAALILVDVEFPALARTLLSRLYPPAGVPHEFFEDEGAALAWLEPKIAGAARSAP